ncbi:hypothetical protein Patl1_29739 [Pistacia atlantica]|uniref:Uncharacterized protein n=1 Tax=Pistacia atlantica TaxID=434234 RepID=A0ACC1ADQ1_9ROSI|nr:hypothetical protein Patl1_29739 [Pistacia atlantica]
MANLWPQLAYVYALLLCLLLATSLVAHITHTFKKIKTFSPLHHHGRGHHHHLHFHHVLYLHQQHLIHHHHHHCQLHLPSS